MGNSRKKIAVAMSGGVDSSVTAALLKEQGHEIFGISMQVWSHSRPEHGASGSGSHINDARGVAEELGIPFYVVNFEEEFRALIIRDFVSEYFSGRTPNPCVRCNQRIKFDLLLAKARSLGAEYLATGHYARIIESEGDGYRLLKGIDQRKDQSYFLFTLTQDRLARTLFPLGGMTKQEVRELAAGYRLPVAEKGESQEICFIPDNDYVRFLEEVEAPGRLSGKIVDSAGNVLGSHDGIYRYTVGQRKGLGIAHVHPLYVLGVNACTREVFVGSREELFSSGLVAAEMNWLIAPPESPFNAVCKIRYRHHPVPCQVRPLPGGRAEVIFAEREKSVTPGQAVVLYEDDMVLGGGWIEGRLQK